MNIIDAGHGGNDTGAISYSGIKEKDMNLEVALKIKSKFDCTLTRDKDVYLGLTERGYMAKDGNLFASLHFNSWNEQSTGCEVFYSVDLPDDKIHAANMSKLLSETLGVPNRGAKVRESINYPGEDYYTVIDKAQDSGCKHVFLFEFGFISNPEEEKKMNTDVIADVLSKYFNENFTEVEEEVVDYTLEFQQWFNDTTQTRNPITEDGIYGPETEWAYNLIGGLIK